MNNRAAVRARREPERADTRKELLNVAGEVFAERGFYGATGTEIRERAGVNIAAINYYFGNLDGLYGAVLSEAWQRMPTLEAYSIAASRHTEPELRLKAVVELFVRSLVESGTSAWAIRLVAKEIIDPSERTQRRWETEGMPKFQFLTSIVAEIMEAAPQDPRVVNGCILAFAPCHVLLSTNPELRSKLFPAFDDGSLDVETTVDQIVKFVVAGLSGLVPIARKRGRKRQQ